MIRTLALGVGGSVSGGLVLTNSKTGETCMISYSGFKIGLGWDISISIHDAVVVWGPHCGRNLAIGNTVLLDGAYKQVSGGFGFSDNGLTLSAGVGAGLSTWFGTGKISVTSISCLNTPCECKEKK